MADFFKLVQNENMKIYLRVRTWIMMGFVVFLPPIISVLFYFGTDGTLPVNWEVMQIESTLLFVLVTIFTVVQASESVAGEFTWGTIKLLLIRPWSRSSILLSKYLSLILFALLFAAVMFLSTFLSNVAIFGYSDTSGIIFNVTSQSEPSSPLSIMLQFYGLQFISLIVVMTFGFMMSSAFRSSGLAIGLSIFLLLSGNIISTLFALADKDWVKYVLFMHLNLSSYLNGGNGPIPNHPTTLAFSLGVLFVYFLLFNAISWTVFRKRDVAA